MGRFLAAGIPATILIHSKDESLNKDNLKIIQKNLSKFIDLSLYDLKKSEKSYFYSLKPDVFDKNIHKTVLEFSEFTGLNSNMIFLDEGADPIKLKEIDKNSFNQENYKCNLIYNKKESGVKTKEYFKEFDYQFPPECWPKLGCDFMSPTKVQIAYITIWTDYDKIDSENETHLLLLLNLLKIASFKNFNELTKTLLFYIRG